MLFGDIKFLPVLLSKRLSVGHFSVCFRVEQHIFLLKKGVRFILWLAHTVGVAPVLLTLQTKGKWKLLIETT